MKRYRTCIFVLSFLTTTSLCLAQTAMEKKEAKPAAAKPGAATSGAKSNAALEAAIIAKEKALWEAFKNKDAKPFKAHLTEDSVMVGEMGVGTKADVIKDIANCDVKDYSLDNFKLTMLNSTTALLTYKSVQHFTCGGQPGPENVYAASIWVNRGGKWVAVFHQETPAKQ